MRKHSMDINWKLWVKNQPGGTLNLPHDWSISQPRKADAASGTGGGFFQGAELMYERELVIEPGMGDSLILEFEGVYNNAEVKLNGNIIAGCRYGYSSFCADISELALRDKPNILKVSANAAAEPNSRWYPGAGIYRHVWLHEGGSCYISPWGTAVETIEVNGGKARLRAKAEIGGDRTNCTFHVTAKDAGGTVIATVESTEDFVDFEISGAKFWSAESPYLYSIESEIIRGGKIIDRRTDRFGVRTIKLDPARGLLINGEVTKLRGGCVHHDNGLLGAASFDRAERRKIELMKASGFNAVRTAHNPPAPSFLAACDELGMYVMDEAFDCWVDPKNPYDYHTAFAADWKKDLTAMVMRDRKHPSVIFWSIGNEIPERDGRNDGYAISKELYEFTKSLDVTRPVTNCICGFYGEMDHLNMTTTPEDWEETNDLWGKRTSEFVKFIDFVGYNYMPGRYESDFKKFNNRIICGTETYPLKAASGWAEVKRLPHVIGDFVWTAIDYLGEAGIGHTWKKGDEFIQFLPYPWHVAWCGDIDICGDKRPQSYLRDAVWGIDKTPYIAVLSPEKTAGDYLVSEWGWPDVESVWDFEGQENQPVEVHIYSSCDEAELFLNGVSCGRKVCGESAEFDTVFEIPYASGELRAVGYKGGKETGSSSIRTPGKPAALRVKPETGGMKGRGDIAYVSIEAVDKDGLRVTSFDGEISVFASGAGKLLALGNSDPTSEEGYIGPNRRARLGKVTAVVIAEENSGAVEITACSGNLKADCLVIPVCG